MSFVNIIVPVYNTQEVLEKCLDSIKNQKYQNWECILIDDGSTDSSGKICDLYKINDSRFKVYHTDNKGTSEAKNLGLKYANGEFITFIDSDDWVDEEYLTFLVNNLQDNDMVMCHSIFEYPDTAIEVFKVIPDKIRFCSSNKKDLLCSCINRGYAKRILNQEQGALNTIWGKLYRLKIIKENNIRFENVSLNEDNIFNLKYFYFMDSAMIYNKILYHYRIRTDSAVHSFKKNYLQEYNDFLNSIDEFIRVKLGNDKDYRLEFDSLCITSLFNITKNYFYNKNNPKKNLRKKQMKKIKQNKKYLEALKKINEISYKNKEVLFCAYAYKYNLYFLLDVYFGIREYLKIVYVKWRKNVTK